MNRVKTIVTLGIFVLTYAFSSAQSTLQVNIKDCREGESSLYNISCKLFKKDSIIKKFNIGFYGGEFEYSGIANDLEYGEYRIEYITMFKKTKSVDVKITESKKYNVDLCYNYMDYEAEEYIPFINQLKNGESYLIQFSSQGCFHTSEKEIVIHKKENKYYLSYKEKENELTENEIEIISHFEKELKYMKSSDCTTIDTYILKYGKKQLKISDGSCMWNGYFHLAKTLGLN